MDIGEKMAQAEIFIDWAKNGVVKVEIDLKMAAIDVYAQYEDSIDRTYVYENSHINSEVMPLYFIAAVEYMALKNELLTMKMIETESSDVGDLELNVSNSKYEVEVKGRIDQVGEYIDTANEVVSYSQKKEKVLVKIS